MCVLRVWHGARGGKRSNAGGEAREGAKEAREEGVEKSEKRACNRFSVVVKYNTEIDEPGLERGERRPRFTKLQEEVT